MVLLMRRFTKILSTWMQH